MKKLCCETCPRIWSAWRPLFKYVLAVAALCIGIVSSNGQDAAFFVERGRSFLETREWTRASDNFRAALVTDAQHAEANALLAISMVLALPDEPGVSEFLDELGVSRENRNVMAWAAELPVDDKGDPILPLNMRVAEAARVLREHVRPQLEGAGLHLARIAEPAFILGLSARETGVEEVRLDYGDVLLVRSALRALEFFILVTGSWNLDVELGALMELDADEAPSAEEFLARYPQLLALARPEDQPLAMAALRDAIEIYLQASRIIRTRAPRAQRLFTLDPEQAGSEADFRHGIEEIRRSLDEAVVLRHAPEYTLHLALLFESSASPRSWLPEIRGDAMVAGTFPDSSFGGIVLGLSPLDLERAMGRNVAPAFRSAGRVGEGFALEFVPTAGMSYSIQRSTDLRTWTEMARGLSVGTDVRALDAGALARPYTFYRSIPLFQPANDEFASRTRVEGSFVRVLGSTRNATRATQDPILQGAVLARTIWWEWTAPASGMARVEVDSGFSLMHGIYAGANLSMPIATGNSVFAVQAGAIYSILVGSPQFGEGTVELRIDLLSRPANDLFANASEIAADRIIRGSNLASTRESNEPLIEGASGGSVWWRWTAPATGRFAIDLIEAESDQNGFVVYSGASLSTLDAVAQSDGFDDFIFFNAEAGQVYHIVLIEEFAGSGTSVAFQVVHVPRPENDSFQDRALISGTRATITTSNVGASADPDEPPFNGVPASSSVWWRWTSPGPGTLVLSTSGSDFDTVLAVYRWSALTGLTNLAQNDDSPYGGHSSEIHLPVEAGTFEIVVDGYEGESGEIVLHLEWLPVPENDDFDNALPLAGLPVITTGHNFRATRELGEPSDGGEKSVWWVWNSGMGGAVEVSVTSQDFDPLVAVYRNSLSGLRFVASGSEAGRFLAQPETDYWIAVYGRAGFGGNEGRFELSIHPALPPANDDFERRSDLPGDAFAGGAFADNLAASKEVGEPDHGGEPGGSSVWWSGSPPVAGEIEFWVVATDFAAILAVYTGDQFDELTEVASAVAPAVGVEARIRFEAVAGTQYKIVVDGKEGGTSGSFLLRSSFVAVSLAPAAATVQAQGAVGSFSQTAPAGGTTQIYTFAAGQGAGATFSVDGVQRGTYTFWNTGDNRARVTLNYASGTLSGATETLDLVFTANLTGQYSGTRVTGTSTTPLGGTFSDFHVMLTQPTTLQNRRINIGPGLLQRQFTMSSASGGTELGTFMDPGSSDTGNYRYTRTSDTEAILVLDNVAGLFPNTSERYVLTFTSSTAGRHVWTAHTGFGATGVIEALGSGPFTFLQ